MKYCKKTDILDIFQMTPERRKNNVDWPEWLNRAWNKSQGVLGSVYPHPHSNDHLLVASPYGLQKASFNDCIAIDSNGCLYVIHEDSFKLDFVALDVPLHHTKELRIVSVRDKDYPFPSMVALGRGLDIQYYVRAVNPPAEDLWERHALIDSVVKCPYYGDDGTCEHERSMKGQCIGKKDPIEKPPRHCPLPHTEPESNILYQPSL